MSAQQGKQIVRRQARGLRRIEDLLDAAAQVFAAVGYDAATTNAIAARAGVSPGSLYQFFPHKEALGRALAARYAAALRDLYGTALAIEVAALALPELLDRIVDPLIAFDLANPGFQALFAGAGIAPQLADVARELDEEILRRVEALVAARAAGLDAERRTLVATIAVRIFKAVLPLALAADLPRRTAIITELKAALRGYLEPLFDASARG